MSEQFGSYYAVNAETAMILAERERKRMSVPWRIWELSAARMNNWGHAAFEPDELVALVCGRCTRADKDVVRHGLDVLAAMGRIAHRQAEPGSTFHCILVNSAVAQRRAGRASDYLCWEAAHARTRKTAFQERVSRGTEAGEQPIASAETAR